MNTIRLSLNRNELEYFAVRTIGLSDAQLRRMSTPFLAQLYQMTIDRQLDTYQMTRVVNLLERRRLSNLSKKSDDAQARGAPTARMRKIAGRWIVFQEHNGVYYYLALAHHDEEKRSICRRVNEVYAFDFPFLYKGAA